MHVFLLILLVLLILLILETYDENLGLGLKSTVNKNFTILALFS